MIIIWNLVKDAVLECRENKAQRLAAALAYYAMGALAPLLILIVAVARLAYGAVVEDRMVGELRMLLGETAGNAIATLIHSLPRPESDPVTTIIGATGLLFVASGLFNHLRDSLNTIWEVTSLPGHPVRGYFFSRLLALSMVLAIGVVALLGLSLSIGIEQAARSLAAFLPGDLSWVALRGGQLLLGVSIVTILVALAYKVLPDTTVAWRDCWIGAGVTALLVVLGQALIGLYLRSGYIGSAYSLVGAVVIILAWVYYSALIFFFGAELTWLYANRFGSRITPAPHAVSLSAGDRAAQGMLRTAEIEAVAQKQRNEP
jgi:membrane protein